MVVIDPLGLIDPHALPRGASRITTVAALEAATDADWLVVNLPATELDRDGVRAHPGRCGRQEQGE